jgi:hypothetical protein
VKYIDSWHPPEVLEVVSGGNTARLGLLSDGTVLKYVYDRDDHWAMKGLEIEHQILTVLGSHQRLVKYVGQHEYGIRFQFEANGDIHRYFSNMDFTTIPIQQEENAGSLFGELDGKSRESTPFFLPRDPLSIPNVKSDLFMLGSIM